MPMPDLVMLPTEENKQALVERLGDARNGLLRVVRDLPADQLLIPVLDEGWSARDIVGHVASWEDRLLTLAQMLINREEHKIEWLEGEEGVNAWNHKEFLRKRDWTWEETIRNLALIREELLWNLGWATPEDLFDLHVASGATVNAADMMEEVIAHDVEHTVHLQAWLARQSDATGVAKS